MDEWFVLSARRDLTGWGGANCCENYETSPVGKRSTNSIVRIDARKLPRKKRQINFKLTRKLIRVKGLHNFSTSHERVSRFKKEQFG